MKGRSSPGNLSSLAASVRVAARARLGEKTVEDVRVSDYVDETGEDAYEIIVVVDQFDPEIMTTEARHSIGDSIIRKLMDQGDERYPYIRFIPREELAEVLADD